jgi:mannose-6-phosphate isomerase-like protein (cupin superfamily)
MNERIRHWIESGKLELYVMGSLSPEEMAEVDAAAAEHPELRAEIGALEESLEAMAMAGAVAPNITLKPYLMAFIDYLVRLQGGKVSGHPVPFLDASSKSSDFDHWLQDAAFGKPADFDQYFAHIIGHDDQKTTAIAWIQTGAPLETHSHTIEKFLILEGSCSLVIEGEVFPLLPGDYLAVPIGKAHYLQVTSTVTCKIILQRQAA